MFFKAYINFKNFCYLSRFRIIPVQSFGSHIRLQPPRLGLRCRTLVNFYREGIFYFLSKIILIFFDDTVQYLAAVLGSASDIALPGLV
jgi:hypothetical protein